MAMSQRPLKSRWPAAQSGLTLAEIIMFILIAGISYVTLIQVFSFAQAKSMEGEARTVMTSLAIERMEIVRSKRYDEHTTPGWSSTLGPDSGELTEAQFDDCDDYQNYIETTMHGYTGYTRRTRAFYINRSNNVSDSVGTITHLKRVIVAVSHPQFGAVTVSSLMASRYGVQEYDDD